MFLLPLAVQAAPVAAAPAPVARATLDSRAAELIGFLNGGGDAAGMFTPEMLAAVPEPRLRAVAGQFTGDLGRAVMIDSLEPVGATGARLSIRFERGFLSANLALEAAAPHRIAGLRFTGAQTGEASLDAVVATLRGLPGLTGFTLARLGDGAPQPIVAHEAARPLAIGSAFKLVILAELVRAVAAGERQWSDTVTLDGGPLPGGAYTQQPAGTKVTLRALAEKMISVSDNSATDILLTHLGRERVEAMLPVVGIADPARNRPMMTTLEVFKLKGLPGDWAARWLAGDEAARRALLAEIDRQPIAAIDPRLFADGKPNHVDIEWFMSPADLTRLLDWLRVHTADGPAAEARAILGINPGIDRNAAGRWRYIGYKGGSEPGVMTMALLLEDRNGGWYALAGSWNDPAAPLDEGRFAAVISRAAALAAGR